MGLFDILGGRSQGEGMSPLMLALLGVLAYRTMHGKGRLADMLGTAGAGIGGATERASTEPAGGLGGMLSDALVGGNRTGPAGGGALGGGGLAGMLGGLLGGGALAGGVEDLLDQFRQNGHGDKADSWVSTGQNESISAPEVGRALGNDRIDWLTRETGMPRDELLSGLSTALPQAVDKLTPNGRVPTEGEAASLLMPPASG
jgi:uncharacterized protein YidB (DUF937 family)